MSTQPSNYPSIRQSVVVTGIELSIGDMCRLTIKWMIAAIPAALIFSFVMMLFGYVMVKYLGGLGVILHSLMDSARGR